MHPQAADFTPALDFVGSNTNVGEPTEGGVRLMLGVIGGAIDMGKDPSHGERLISASSEFCLRLSQLCPDDLVAAHLTRKAAQYTSS